MTTRPPRSPFHQADFAAAMLNFVRRIRASNVVVADGLASTFRPFLRSLNAWFWAIFGLPTLLAAVYYFAIASDLYMSEVKFLVRGGAKGSSNLQAAGAMMQDG